MPEIPTPIIVHKTKELQSDLKPGGTTRVVIGRTRDRSQFAVWIETNGPTGPTLRPVVFTSAAEEAAERYNEQLQILADNGYPTGSELMIDRESALKWIQ